MTDKQEKKDSSATQDGSATSSVTQSPPPTLLSWSIRGLSVLLVTGLLVYFSWSALRPTETPDIVFSILQDEIEQRSEGWVMPVEVMNRSTASVHSLTVAALTTRGEEKTLSVGLLGPNEMVTADFWFDTDPRKSDPALSVKSYLLP